MKTKIVIFLERLSLFVQYYFIVDKPTADKFIIAAITSVTVLLAYIIGDSIGVLTFKN